MNSLFSYLKEDGLVKAVGLIIECGCDIGNLPLSIVSLVKNRRYSAYIGKNIEYKNAFYGKRCFIIGNGPSLKGIDLKQLKSEYSFFVNRSYKIEGYDEASPSFHCAIDSNMYGKHGDEFLRVIDSHPNTQYICSRRAISFANGRQNVSYVYYQKLPSRHCHPYNIERPSATFVNVIPFAIQCAIYMGFKRIVLIGCDFNQFATKKQLHAYNDCNEMRNKQLYLDLLGHSIALLQHKYLKEYAGRKGISIVNATSESLLDVYEMVSLSDELDLD